MRYFSLILVASLFLVSCKNEKEAKKKDPFLITATTVGKLSIDTPVSALDSIYAQDSLVKNRHPEMQMNNQDIEVFDRNGKELLTLDPVTTFDSTSTIANIQIKDPRYKTKKGLGLKSTFKTISKNYKISRIENTLSNAVIFLDQDNIYLAIDKENISGSGQFDTSSKIEPTQIPDDAPIKYIWIGWK